MRIGLKTPHRRPPSGPPAPRRSPRARDTQAAHPAERSPPPIAMQHCQQAMPGRGRTAPGLAIARGANFRRVIYYVYFVTPGIGAEARGRGPESDRLQRAASAPQAAAWGRYSQLCRRRQGRGHEQPPARARAHRSAQDTAAAHAADAGAPQPLALPRWLLVRRPLHQPGADMTGSQRSATAYAGTG